MNQSPNSDAATRAKIFISYSSVDGAFAEQLAPALEANGFDPLIDVHGISGAEDWEKRLGDLILIADTVVFVLSPDSVQSPVCQWEVDEATRLNKRIIPVIIRDLEGHKAPQALGSLNYIQFMPSERFPKAGFWTGLNELVEALKTDVGWLRDHTRLTEQAERWHQRARPEELLLRGSELTHFQDWQSARPTGAPELTLLQREFLDLSAEAEQQRERDANAKIAERERLLSEQETLQRENEQQSIRMRKFTRYGLVAAVIMQLGALIGGYFAIYGDETTTEARSNLFAQQARQLNDPKTAEYDKAMLFALMGKPAGEFNPWHKLTPKRVKTDRARAQLLRGYVNSSLEKTLTGHGDDVNSVAFSPDGRLIVTGSWDATAKIWDAKTGEELKILSGHENTINAASFSPDSRWIVTASGDNTAKIWDVQTGEEINTLNGHTDNVTAASFSPDGRWIVTGSTDTTAKIWELDPIHYEKPKTQVAMACAKLKASGADFFTKQDRDQYSLLIDDNIPFDKETGRYYPCQ